MSTTFKILVVDDNPTILRLLCRALEKCGELVMAKDGADALAKAVESRPDLIISDYHMPVMDGHALFEKLRAQSETAEIPFVFLASQKEIDERLRMVAEGAEDCLMKPFFVPDLSRQIRRVTARLYQQKMEKEGTRGGAIAGRLSEMSMIDWIQSLEQGRKTCALLLRSGVDSCTLYFKEGQVIHALCGDLQGNEAVYKVLAWTEGEWEVDFSRSSSEHSTTLSTQGLMMEGLRLLDEAKHERG